MQPGTNRRVAAPARRRQVPARAIVLAGGQGRRLYPFTAALPKPLLPVWDMPVVELLVRLLARKGIGEIVLAVNHLADLIVSYFGDGNRLGIKVDFLRERKALGTAGALSLLPAWTGDILVTNGDVVADIDIAAMYRRHRALGAAITVASITRRLQSDSGVLDVDADGYLVRIEEKPVRHERIAIGVYIVGEGVRGLLHAEERIDMPDLIARLIAGGGRVAVFEHSGLWLDIGRPEEYARAQSDLEIERMVKTARDGAP